MSWQSRQCFLQRVRKRIFSEIPSLSKNTLPAKPQKNNETYWKDQSLKNYTRCSRRQNAWNETLQVNERKN